MQQERIRHTAHVQKDDTKFFDTLSFVLLTVPTALYRSLQLLSDSCPRVLALWFLTSALMVW